MPASRWLLPREYGAYAELAFPIITAMIAGRPTVAAVGFSVAAAAGFLVHEPIEVLRGTRGERRRQTFARQARVRIWWLLVAGAAAAAAALILAPPSARWAALAPGACFVALIPAIARRREKTLVAELIMAAGLAAMMLPVGTAAGVSWEYALVATAVWFVSFALATLTVHAVKVAYGKKGARGSVVLTSVLALGVVVGAAALAVSSAWPLAGLALLPVPLLALAVTVMRVHPRNLRRVGWSLVVANLGTLALLLAA
ncbi:MAG: YwiC-like family protein [Gemmatimonadetes bacterium]|nr:YwiC-like family protein [Gemmatimonadota bacterium]